MEGKLCFRSHSPQRRQTWTNYDRWQGCIVGLLQLRQAWKLVIKSELWRQRLKWIPRTSNHRILSVLFYFLTRGAKLCITWSYTNWYGMLWRKYYHSFQVRTYSNLLHVPFAAFTHTSIGAKTLFDFCGFRGGLRDFAFGMASWLLFLGPSCCGNNDTIALATKSLSKGLEAKRDKHICIRYL